MNHPASHLPSLQRRLADVLAVVLVASAGQRPAGPALPTNPQVEKCSAELGTLAVAEPQAHVISGLHRYGLGSPSTMLRMLVAGIGLLRGRRARRRDAEPAAGTRAGRRRPAAGRARTSAAARWQVADFVMTPVVQFSRRHRRRRRLASAACSTGPACWRHSAAWPAASSSRKPKPTCWSPTCARASRSPAPKARPAR